MAYAIPTDEERPILFRWLKQQASFTIWAQIDSYYAEWESEFRRITPLALDSSDGLPAINESETRLMLSCRAAFVGALAKLRQGDRSVFKWLGYGTGQGYFCEAWRVVSAWQTSRGRIQEGLPLADTEYWPGFEEKFDALVAAWGNGTEALQERHTDVPAPVQDMRWLRGDIEPGAYPTYRAVLTSGMTLPPVPTPLDEIIVPTGRDIPCYGIWEPVKLRLSPGVVGLFKKPLVPRDGEFKLDGCMNYLHAGSPAPTLGFEEDGIRHEGRPTTWRLLWRDDRYIDGSIPEEEMSYVFRHPDAREAAALVAYGEASITVLESGQQATVGGRWALQDSLYVTVTLAAGEKLPLYRGRTGRWVLSDT